MESKHDSDVTKDGEVLPAKFAYNLVLKRDFPYYDERDDAILVRRLNSDELVWSPKSLWDLHYHPPIIEPISELVPKELFKIRIRDEDVYWTFKITEDEVNMLEKGELELFWNPGWIQKDPERQKEKSVIKAWEKKREELKLTGAGLFVLKQEEHRYRRTLRKIIKKESKRVSHRGWCLVTRKQRELLMNRVNYSEHYNQLIKEGGSEAWSEWSSIRWIKHGPKWREYMRITRTPLRKSQPAISIETKSDDVNIDSQKGEEYRPKFIKRFKKR